MTVSNTDNADPTKPAKTESALQTPEDYTGIYADWNDLDDDDNPDSETFWDFGSTSDYPKLKVDFDGNNIATVSEFGSQ